MGREIRRVPPHWEHPTRMKWDYRKGREVEDYQPMYDEDVQSAYDDWLAEYANWNLGEHARIVSKYGDEDYPLGEPYRAFCNWHGTPPDPKYYRPAWRDEAATWYQVYETLSEGTPVSPPFATREELIDYLVEHGDFWDQKRRAEPFPSMPCDPWSREAATKFVMGPGWAPSMVVDNGVAMSGVEALARKED